MKNDVDNLHKQIKSFKDKIAPKKKKENFADNYKLSNIAVEIAAIPIVACIFGYFIDKIFNTLPIFLLICLIFGVISSFVQGYKIITKDSDKK
jgi:F0F1-type ATP synthase assembly protein I